LFCAEIRKNKTPVRPAGQGSHQEGTGPLLKSPFAKRKSISAEMQAIVNPLRRAKKPERKVRAFCFVCIISFEFLQKRQVKLKTDPIFYPLQIHKQKRAARCRSLNLIYSYYAGNFAQNHTLVAVNRGVVGIFRQ